MVLDTRKVLRELKNNFRAVNAVADFYDTLLDMRLIDEKEVEETRLKMKYSKQQLLTLLLRNKKLVMIFEKEEKL